jgi:small subunit ribosomal protein S7
MSRRQAAEKREVAPDSRYGDVIVSRFVNALMWKGKRSLAERVFYGALEKVAKLEKREPVPFFHEILERCKPALEVRSRRVGGATYPVPVSLRPERAQALSIRWLIQSARKRSEKTMNERLFGEMRDASAGRGGAIKKKEDTEKMAEANRSFSHYRW